MTSDADARSSQLYELPPEEFTAARNALAAELKAEGDGQGAAAVKALRKPTRAGWAVNRLVRSEPELVDALMGAGGELRQAHRQAASGHGAEQLRAAAESERAAVEQLMARAPADVSPAVAQAMRETLHAASSDDEARELVREGRVVEPLRPVGLGPVPAGMRSGAAPAARRKAPASEAERKKAARAAAEAERRAREAHARALKGARAEEVALRREADAAQRSLERAEQALSRAREAADAADERAKDARRRVRTAKTALSEAERRLARIERDAPE
jgi:hypothetical protein